MTAPAFAPEAVGVLRAVVAEVHELARKKGWWDGVATPRNPVGLPMSAAEILSKIALVHSELSEAVEIVRDPDPSLMFWRNFATADGKPEGFGVELADAVIRIFDLAGALGIDIAACIAEKHAYNVTREQRHGGKRA